ncbi:SRPBCC family protein [Flavitalea flava]
MPNILHRILIKAKPDKVFRTFSTMDGLQQWWTKTASSEGVIQPGTILLFRFGTDGTEMRITHLIPGKRVEWQCVGGPDDWIGTRLFFDVEPHGDKTILHFGQRGWREENDFFMHCNSVWGYFMLSLKSLVETGKGTPYPEAIEI